MYNLYDAENRVFTCEQQTSVYYEALHNVNKRMVANLILDRSKVVTYEEQFELSLGSSSTYGK
jgi:hypothetical protein